MYYCKITIPTKVKRRWHVVQLDMEDNDIIDVMQTQLGGSTNQALTANRLEISC